MTKFIIVIGRKYFSNYVAQNNYWPIIQIKLLTTLIKKNTKQIKQMTVARFLKHGKDFFN